MNERQNRIFLEITTECNLKCQYCHLWKRKDNNNSLSTKYKLDFLERIFAKSKNENKEIESQNQITLTGGEPFLKPKEIFKISRLCRDHQVQCYINTNGTLVKGIKKEILMSGLTAIAFSIDSYRERIHDGLRNKTGLFRYVIKEIKDIIRRKYKLESNLKICVQSILGSWNINEIENHILFFENLNLDGISFQPIQYPFGLPIPENWYKNYEYFPKSQKEVSKAIESLIRYKKKNEFLLNSLKEIKLWESYFKNPQYIARKHHICGAYSQNIIIDLYGNVKFCFNKNLEPLNFVGNIMNQNLDEILHSINAQEIRKEMKRCNRSCGIMTCHIDQKLRESK